jgi:hypothetical protein
MSTPVGFRLDTQPLTVPPLSPVELRTDAGGVVVEDGPGNGMSGFTGGRNQSGRTPGQGLFTGVPTEQKTEFAIKDLARERVIASATDMADTAKAERDETKKLIERATAIVKPPVKDAEADEAAKVLVEGVTARLNDRGSINDKERPGLLLASNFAKNSRGFFDVAAAKEMLLEFDRTVNQGGKFGDKPTDVVDLRAMISTWEQAGRNLVKDQLNDIQQAKDQLAMRKQFLDPISQSDSAKQLTNAQLGNGFLASVANLGRPQMAVSRQTPVDPGDNAETDPDDGNA